MIAAIHQPQYMPWTGYMDKMDQADAFIYLDTVSYKVGEWQNRNRIRTAWGWQWLTVPALHGQGEPIKDVKVDNRHGWQRKHIRAIETHYGKAAHFGSFMPAVAGLLDREWAGLSELSRATAELCREAMGITTRTVTASEFDARDDPTLRLIDLCRAVGADTYLSGRDGGKYMDMASFEEAGISVVFQEFSPGPYRQAYQGFEPGLSAIDLIFNTGDEALGLMRGWRERIS